MEIKKAKINIGSLTYKEMLQIADENNLTFKQLLKIFESCDKILFKKEQLQAKENLSNIVNRDKQEVRK